MNSVTKFNELVSHEAFTRQGRADLVGFVVMPPGCGKSYYHTKISGLIEADSVYDCRGNQHLRELRKAARETRDWREYDKAWANEIRIRLTGQLWVIMVPAYSVGMAIGAQHLSSLSLREDAWNENLKSRGKTAQDYEYALHDLGGGILYRSNEDLEMSLFSTTRFWMGEMNIPNWPDQTSDSD